MAFQCTVFETAAEFFDECEGTTIPATVYVVHDDGPPRLSGEGAMGFSLELLDWSDLIEEALSRAGGISVHFT